MDTVEGRRGRAPAALAILAAAVCLLGATPLPQDAAAGEAPTAGGGARRDPGGRPEAEILLEGDHALWQGLSPAERARLRQGLQRLEGLPREDRSALREALGRWQRLSAEERVELRRRLDRLAELTPEERHALQRRIEELGELAPEQRERVRAAVKRWREMSSEERQRLRDQLRERLERRRGTP